MNLPLEMIVLNKYWTVALFLNTRISFIYRNLLSKLLELRLERSYELVVLRPGRPCICNHFFSESVN